MSSVSEGEGTDETLDSLSFKALRKFECFFLEDEKIVFTLNSFFIVVSLFDVEGSVCDSMDDRVRILGRQGVDPCFAFKVDALLDEEGLGKMKQQCE